MALIKFFRVPRHQRFEYKPRHWNQQKEELNQRVQRINNIEKEGTDAMKTRLTGSFRRGGYFGRQPCPQSASPSI